MMFSVTNPFLDDIHIFKSNYTGHERKETGDNNPQRHVTSSV